MSQPGLSREVALAIGLASNALPDTQVKQLMRILLASLGMPLTAAKLKSLTLQQYQQALSDQVLHAYSKSDLLVSLAYLHQQSNSIVKAQIKPYSPGDMPHSIRLAISSQDGLYINSQFSNCKHFYIFQVSAQEQRLIAIRAAESLEPLTTAQKQSYRAGLIQDCQVLYSLVIGGAAAAKVIKRGVHPIKLSSAVLSIEIIEQLQHVLLTSPPPWLAKSMGLAKAPLTYQQQEEML